MLVLICTVCGEPKFVPTKTHELFIHECAFIKCPNCLQCSEITEELRNDIRNNWGVQN